MVARKRNSTTRPGRDRFAVSITAASGRAPRAPRRGRGARGGTASPPGSRSRRGRRSRSVRAARQRGLDRLDVVRRRDDAGARLADQVGRGAVRRHDGEDRPLGREVLEDLAREHALAAAARVRDQEQERLGVALELERGLARRVRDQLELVSEPAFRRPFAVGRAEVAEEARLHVEAGLVQRGQERPRVALAEEAAGVGDPEALPGRVVEPGEVVEVAAVRDRHDLPLRREAARLVGDRVGDARDRIGRVRHEPRDASVDLLLRAHGHALRAPVRVRDERVTQIRDPFRARRLLHRGADEMDRVRRRGGDDDVDPLLARDPDRGGDRGQVPAHVLVRDEQAPRGELRLHERALEPLLAVQLLGGLAPLRADVAGAVHPRLRRLAEVGVLVDPLRVVRRQHVRLDPERGQVLRELERSLDAAAAGRRPVERDEQQFHAPDATRVVGGASASIEGRGGADPFAIPVERHLGIPLVDHRGLGRAREQLELVVEDRHAVGRGDRPQIE